MPEIYLLSGSCLIVGSVPLHWRFRSAVASFRNQVRFGSSALLIVNRDSIAKLYASGTHAWQPRPSRDNCCFVCRPILVRQHRWSTFLEPDRFRASRALYFQREDWRGGMVMLARAPPL